VYSCAYVCNRLNQRVQALALLRRSHDTWRVAIANALKFDNDAGDDAANTSTAETTTITTSSTTNSNNADDDGDYQAVGEQELMSVPSFEHRVETARLYLELQDRERVCVVRVCG
jgi:hypothetical protein